MAQTLGGYAFEDDPERMPIPEAKKTVAAVDTYSGTAVFQWPAIIAGQQVTLEWTLVEVAQYEALRAIYLSHDPVEWLPGDGKSYQVVVADLTGKYADALFHHKPYRFDVELVLLILSANVIPE